MQDSDETVSTISDSFTTHIPDVWPQDVESYFQRMIRKHVLQFDLVSECMSKAITQNQFPSWATLNLDPSSFTPDICRAHFASTQIKKDMIRNHPHRPIPAVPNSPQSPEPTRHQFSFLSGLETPAGQRNVLTDAPISSIFDDAQQQLPHRVAAAGRVQLRDMAAGCSSDEEVVSADLRADAAPAEGSACDSESGSEGGLDPTRMDVARYTRAVMNHVLRDTDTYTRPAPRAHNDEPQEDAHADGPAGAPPATPTAATPAAPIPARDAEEARWGANDNATSRYIHSSRQLATARALLDVIDQEREEDDASAAAAALDAALDAEFAMMSNKDAE